MTKIVDVCRMILSIDFYQVIDFICNILASASAKFKMGGLKTTDGYFINF